MGLETRSFDDPVLVTAVGRYTPAERSGLVAGDIILAFGTHKPSELKEDPELVDRIGAKDWLAVLRGPVYFKLQPRDGLAGATFEAATPLENVEIPAEGPGWYSCSAGMQSDGSLMLVPETISPFWVFMPVLLYARYRLWQMMTGAVLVYGITAMMGLVPFVLTYVVTSLPILTSGAYLIRSIAEKQGFAKRGDIMIATSGDIAALEVETYKRNQAARKPAPPPKSVEAVTDGAV